MPKNTYKRPETKIVVDLPATESGIPVSLTQFQMYMNCPRQWFYQYKKGLPTATSMPLVMGTLIHSVLEKIWATRPVDGHKTPVIDDFKAHERIRQAICKAMTDIYQIEYAASEDDLKELAADDITEMGKQVSFILHVASQRLTWRLVNMVCRERTRDSLSDAWDNIKPTANERKYVVVNKDGKKILSALIDAVHEDLDKNMTPLVMEGKSRRTVRIVDYKTSKRVSRSTYKEEYEFQVYLYAWLYYLDTGFLPEKGIIDYVFYGQELVVDIKMEHIEFIEKAIRSFIAELNHTQEEIGYVCNRQMKFGNKFNCDYCAFENVCSKFPTMPPAKLPPLVGKDDVLGLNL